MMLSQSEITSFQQEILSWYEENKRQLPWRDLPFDSRKRQRDPYRILVSEIMAQQTQLSRVIPKYAAWLERFPTIENLAQAPTREVLLHWSGLGYNSRAINLQKTARIIVEQHKGVFPRTFDELILLPGIGEYTANALLCFAFNKQVAVVDTNVRKVILVSFGQSLQPKEIKEIAQGLLPKGRAYEWNQALMDYAASVLKKEKIIIPKQSPYRTSNRYFRGQTMKILVRQHTVTVADLWQYFQEHNPIDVVRLQSVLQTLEKDGLLRIEGKKVTIV